MYSGTGLGCTMCVCRDSTGISASRERQRLPESHASSDSLVTVAPSSRDSNSVCCCRWLACRDADFTQGSHPLCCRKCCHCASTHGQLEAGQRSVESHATASEQHSDNWRQSFVEPHGQSKCCHSASAHTQHTHSGTGLGCRRRYIRCSLPRQRQPACTQPGQGLPSHVHPTKQYRNSL